MARPGVDVTRLAAMPAVRAALDAIRVDEARTIQDQVRLCEIPAPPFQETARAQAYAEKFRAAGLAGVHIDAAGNVIGERPGQSGQPHLVLGAHLDTIFPKDTRVAVTRTGSVLRGPGIADNCRGLAVLLAVARAIDAAGVKTPGTITFVGTVGEEGLGDLRGVKSLFTGGLAGRIDRFVSVDGSGHGITNVAVGSRRYRVTFRGPGGHSYDNFGRANPAHALGRAVALLADLKVPAHPRTTFGVGRIGGGASVNAIPADAWMEVDLRSLDAAALETLDADFRRVVDRALMLENARWKQNGRLSVSVDRVGDRPAGRTDESSLLVQTALATGADAGHHLTPGTRVDRREPADDAEGAGDHRGRWRLCSRDPLAAGNFRHDRLVARFSKGASARYCTCSLTGTRNPEPGTPEPPEPRTCPSVRVLSPRRLTSVPGTSRARRRAGVPRRLARAPLG